MHRSNVAVLYMWMTVGLLDSIMDTVYYYVFRDALGKCRCCNYKNNVVYKCDTCDMKICLTCYMDACIGRTCKWCVEKTYVKV